MRLRSFIIGVGAALLLLALVFYIDPFDPRGIPGKVFYLLLLLLIVFAFPALVFFHRRLSPPTSAIERRGALAILAVAFCVLFLLMVESAARLFPLVDSQPINPGVEHFWPDYNYPLNALGNRDLEPSIITRNGDRAEIKYITGQRRILVVGDSFTEGFGVLRSELYTRHLENELNRLDGAGKNLVVNAGQRGYNTEREISLMARQMDLVRPEIIVLAFVPNDVELTGQQSFGLSRSNNWFSGFLWGAAFTLMRPGGSYAFYRYLQQFEMKIGQNYAEELPRQYSADSPGYQAVLNSFRKLKKIELEKKVRTVVIILPFFHREAHRLENISRQVFADAVRLELEAYDFTPKFLKAGKLENFGISDNDFHPNARAHRLIGEWLLEIIKEDTEQSK